MWEISNAMPIQGFIGGIMIGIASAILLIGVGRIAGISGLFGRASGLTRTDTPWKVAAGFIVSLLVGAWIVQVASNEGVVTRYPSEVLLVAGGLLVGFGTRLGSGCTSGHGVCGMSRLSRRSLIATPIFIGSGTLTVALMNFAGIGQ